MIITIIGCILLVLGIVGTIITIKCDFSHDKEAEIGGFSIAIAICGGITIFICLGVIVAVHCTADNDIYNAGLERKCLMKQIECINSEYEDVSKTDVIRNVYEWNKKVHKAQHYSNSIWTNWFWDADYVNSLQYIEVKDL